MNFVRTIKADLLIAAFLLICSPKLRAEESTDFMLTSTSFKNLGPIPKKYTCYGDNISPQLSWSSPPAGTKSFVLIVEDPDDHGETRDHWIVYNIPAAISSTKEGELPKGSVAGVHDKNKSEYRGPCSPDKNHRYFFKLYALRQPLELPDGASKQQVEKAMHPFILGQADLIGVY